MIPIMPAGFIGLQSPPAADEVDDQNHDRDYEQNVNESAHRVRTDQTKQPEHQQNDKYCPKHNGFLELSLPYFVFEGRTALMEYGQFSKLLPVGRNTKILSPAKTTDFESNPAVRPTANLSFSLPGNEDARRVRPLESLQDYSSFNASRRFQSTRSSRDRALSRLHPANCETRPIARSRSFLLVG